MSYIYSKGFVVGNTLRFMAIVSYAGKLIYAGQSENTATKEWTHGRWLGRGSTETAAIRDAEKHLAKSRVKS